MLKPLAYALLIALAFCSPLRAQTAWTDRALDDLISVASSAPLEGFPANAATVAELTRLRQTPPNPLTDVMLYDTADALFAKLASSFAQGAVAPAETDPSWAIPMAAAADIPALRRSLLGGAMPSTLLPPLLPQTSEYAALKQEFAALQKNRAAANRKERLMHLRASLERWRWLPRNLPTRRIDVRIAQFELRMIEPAQPASVHKVIVGAKSTPTPSFAGQIQSITLNPVWYPPSTIVAELAQRFRGAPQAAAREGFQALDAQGATVPLATLDWNAKPFPYRLRQNAGPANALGRIRFDLVNPFAIRLHDTPNKELFIRSQRAFSHGCIRVEAPEQLALRILAAPAWTSQTLQTAIDAKQTQTLELAAPLPVYLIYITAAQNADGGINYAKDIYGRDAAIAKALEEEHITVKRQVKTGPSECAPA